MIKVGDIYKVIPFSLRYRVESITNNLITLYCIENSNLYPYPLNDTTRWEIEAHWVLCEPDYTEGEMFV